MYTGNIDAPSIEIQEMTSNMLFPYLKTNQHFDWTTEIMKQHKYIWLQNMEVNTHRYKPYPDSYLVSDLRTTARPA